MRVVLLGGSGLLGTAMRAALDSCGLETLEPSREGPPRLDADYPLADNPELLDVLVPDAVVINCVGMVRHRIGSDPSSIAKAVKRNVLFPIELAELSEERGFRVMQVLTDCVFSGDVGSYSELSKKDAKDTYGMTKSLGEINHQNFFGLRSSILGTSMRGPRQFYDWVRYAPRNSRISGYTNHKWNGVTARVVATIFAKIIESGSKPRGIHHLVPANVVSKYDLALLVADREGRLDLQIDPVEGEVAIDRSLTTIDNELNEDLFRLAGFNGLPTISSMLDLGVDLQAD